MPANTGFRELAPRDVLRFSIDSAEAEIDLVPASDGRRICLLSIVLTQGGESQASGSGSGSIGFLSGATEIGAVAFDSNSAPLVLPSSPDGWLQTNEGEKLAIANPDQLPLKGFGTCVLI